MFDRFVGIPYVEQGRTSAGCDCWGLVRLAFGYERGIVLPSYCRSYSVGSGRAELAALITGEAAAYWREIEAGGEQSWDCVLMRDGREPSHIGLVVEPGRLLHVERGNTSVIERYRVGVLANRVLGFYRYQNSR